MHIDPREHHQPTIVTWPIQYNDDDDDSICLAAFLQRWCVARDFSRFLATVPRRSVSPEWTLCRDAAVGFTIAFVAGCTFDRSKVSFKTWNELSRDSARVSLNYSWRDCCRNHTFLSFHRTKLQIKQIYTVLLSSQKKRQNDSLERYDKMYDLHAKMHEISDSFTKKYYW